MLVAWLTVVTVAQEVKAEGSVIVLRNGVSDGCDQAKPQEPMNKNRIARGWRKQRMRTSSQKNYPGGTRS